MSQTDLSLTGFSRLPVVRQTAQAECGLACVVMIASYYGFKTDLTEMRRRHDISSRGTDLVQLNKVAQEIGLSGRGLRCEVEELRDLRTPCILHWGFNHFVVLKKADRTGVTIHDPAIGMVRLSQSEVSEKFTGIALELTRAENFKPKAPPRKLSLFDMLRFDGAFLSPFGLGLSLAILAELALLASPFYLQIVIDEVLLKGDRNLLNTLAIGFGALLVFQALSGLLRQLTLQYLGQVVSFDIAARLFHRMMRLPASFFLKRELGDIQHRIRSLEAIKYFLNSGAIAILIDVLFFFAVLGLLFIYSGMLTALVLGFGLAYILWRMMLFRFMRRAAGDLLIAEAGEQTHLLESLRAIQTVKTSGLEAARESQWRNNMARRVNAQIRVGNLSIVEQSVTTLLLDGARVFIIFFAATQVIGETLTVGMLTAFAAYFGMFNQRIRALADHIVQYLLLQVPLQRVADIAFAPPEPRGEDGGRSSQMEGRVELRNAAFRYGQSDDWVLRGASFIAEPGEFVAITGASGAGKSTILRIIGLLETLQHGELLFDGRPVRSWSLETLRRNIGVVMQDDTLFQGSIADNIAAFDEQIDMTRVREAAEMAAIHADIESFPMGYETLVGDMGSTLSGGQKQRVVLARCLYRKPKIILLDEATSHLDQDNESKLNEASLI